jgi:hypothetical protein
MKHIGKGLSLLFALTLIVSGQMMVEPVYSQSTSKPSVPEFRVNVAHPNDAAPTIEITINNQPFTPSVDASGNNTSLYYNVRFKGHYASDWTYYPQNRNSSYIAASTTDYTTITLALGSPPLGAIPAGGQVDFQVQALIGHDNQISSNQYEFAGEVGNWSSPQTIIMPETSPSGSPSPSAPPLTSTQVSIAVDTSSATVGASVNINGKLTDTNGNPLPSKAVTLSYTLAGGSDRVPVGSDTTNVDGEYTIQWVNTASGTFTLTVEWSGDSVYEPSSNTTTLTFLPYQNQNIFLVESNSTVTALAYNSTTSELSFSVSGASETTGYVKITLSKTLTSSPENIKVYLDGNQLDYLVASNDDSYQLTFNYHHSTHQVTITLGSTSSASFFQTQLGELVIVGVALAISIAAVLIALRKRKKSIPV